MGELTRQGNPRAGAHHMRAAAGAELLDLHTMLMQPRLATVPLSLRISA